MFPLRAVVIGLGIELFDVLGQHQDRQGRQLPAGGQRCRQALGGMGGRQADVEDGDVGAVLDQKGGRARELAAHGKTCKSRAAMTMNGASKPTDA